MPDRTYQGAEACDPHALVRKSTGLSLPITWAMRGLTHGLIIYGSNPPALERSGVDRLTLLDGVRLYWCGGRPDLVQVLVKATSRLAACRSEGWNHLFGQGDDGQETVEPRCVGFLHPETDGFLPDSVEELIP